MLDSRAIALLNKIHNENPRLERYVARCIEERLAKVLAKNLNADESEKNKIKAEITNIVRSELNPKIILEPLQRLREDPNLANQMQKALDFASRGNKIASRISVVDVMRAYLMHESFDMDKIKSALAKIDESFSGDKDKYISRIQAAIRFITTGNLSTIDPMLINIFAGEYAHQMPRQSAPEAMGQWVLEQIKKRGGDNIPDSIRYWPSLVVPD